MTTPGTIQLRVEGRRYEAWQTPQATLNGDDEKREVRTPWGVTVLTRPGRWAIWAVEAKRVVILCRTEDLRHLGG